MKTYLVGSEIRMLVVVSESYVAVDPSLFVFRLKPASGSALATGTYSWSSVTSSWTVSESTLATPERTATGTFQLTVLVPYDNTSRGRWTAGWKSTKNGGGLGEGSGEDEFEILPARVLDA